MNDSSTSNEINDQINFVRTESFFEKIVRTPFAWICFFVLVFSYPIYRSMNRELPPPLPVYFTLPDYKLTNEFGKEFGAANLKGKPYVANFFFSNCPTTCPALMETMQTVQKRVRGLGDKVGIVSFSVDPENDTPQVLYKYARQLQSNPHVWAFLTGDKDVLHELLVNQFKVPMGELEEFQAVVDGFEIGLFDIAHSNQLVLVDGNNQIRGYYSSVEKTDVDRLMIDLGLLINNQFATNL